MIAPLFILAGLAACGVPIALHLLRPKPQRIIPFPTLRFLQPAALRDNRRHKILRWLVLALRCLALLLIGFAFARPLFNQSTPDEGQAVVFVVDNSFSMQTDNRQRELTTWALEQVNDLRPHASAGLLLMQPHPRWAVPFGAELSDVKTRLKNMEPGYEISEYRSAIRLAGECLRESPARVRRIVLLGDHQQLAWRHVDFNEPLPPGVELILPPAPVMPLSQIAVTKFDVLQENGRRSAVVSVMPYAVAHADHTLTLRIDGEIAATKTIQLMPGQPARVPFDLPTDREQQWLQASMDSDALPADNSMYTIMRQRNIDLQLSPTNEHVDYLAIAIDADSHTEQSPMRVVDWPKNEWPTENIALLRGEASFQDAEVAKLDRFLSGGGRAILFYNGEPAQKKWLQRHGIATAPVSDLDGALSLRDWDLDHPSLAPFADSDISPLLQLRFLGGQSLSPEQVWPIARWPDRSVALAEASINGGTVMIAGFEPHGDSSLVRSAVFLPLVHGMVRWLSGQGQSTENLQVGDVLELPSAGQWRALAGPNQGQHMRTDGAISLTVPGVFQFSDDNDARILYAVNVSTQESDLRPWPETADFALLQNPARPPQSQAHAMRATQPSRIAWWLLALAVIFILSEVQLSNQTAR